MIVKRLDRMSHMEFEAHASNVHRPTDPMM
jgi:hypothetical protein